MTNRDFRRKASEKVTLRIKICLKMIEYYDVRMRDKGTIYTKTRNI